MQTIDTFPVTLNQNDTFTFTYEGVTRSARVNYVHVFNEGSALAEHLRLTGIGLYDGLTLLDENGNPVLNANVQPQATLEAQVNRQP
jgi:hypothetical protein